MVLFKDKIDALEATDKDKINQIVEKCRTYEKEIFENEDLRNMFDTCKYCARSSSNKVQKCLDNNTYEFNGITFRIDDCFANMRIKATINYAIHDKEGNVKNVKFRIAIYDRMIKFFCNTGWAPDEKAISDVITSATIFYSVDDEKYKMAALMDVSKDEYIRATISENDLYTIYYCLKETLPQYAKKVLENLDGKLSHICGQDEHIRYYRDYVKNVPDTKKEACIYASTHKGDYEELFKFYMDNHKAEYAYEKAVKQIKADKQ